MKNLMRRVIIAAVFLASCGRHHVEDDKSLTTEETTEDKGKDLPSLEASAGNPFASFLGSYKVTKRSCIPDRQIEREIYRITIFYDDNKPTRLLMQTSFTTKGGEGFFTQGLGGGESYCSGFCVGGKIKVAEGPNASAVLTSNTAYHQMNALIELDSRWEMKVKDDARVELTQWDRWRRHGDFHNPEEVSEEYYCVSELEPTNK